MNLAGGPLVFCTQCFLLSNTLEYRRCPVAWNVRVKFSRHAARIPTANDTMRSKHPHCALANRRVLRRFLIRHESRTEDNQDSKDHFCGPLNKRNDTKISCILSCFLECFVGKPSVAAEPLWVIRGYSVFAATSGAALLYLNLGAHLLQTRSQSVNLLLLPCDDGLLFLVFPMVL